MAESMYMQIAEDLRNKIRTGELAPGSQLPPEPVLQDEYSKRSEFSSSKVSRNTVRDAIQVLVLERRVEKRPGQGTFVVEKIAPFVTRLSGDPEGGGSVDYALQVTQLGRKRTESVPRVEIHPSAKVPELKLGPGELVISRHQQRFIDGKPYSLQTSFYPMSYAAEAPDLIAAKDLDKGAVEYIREKMDIKQVGWREVLRVRPADTVETGFFGLSAKSGGQVLEAFRTAYGSDGGPTRLTVTVYAADRNRVAYEAGVVPPMEVPPTSPDPARP